ncbi:hypothetical protein ACFL52_04040, partial [Candidatus Margulisiibacteriota bacterium]
MKKIICTCILVLFSASIALAYNIDDKIRRTENEISRLNNKLSYAKSASHRSKILALIKQYKVNLTKLKHERAKAGKRVLIPKIGLSGGAALLGVGMHAPFKQYNLSGTLGYGLGNNYSVIDVRGGIIINKNFEVALTVGNYSKAVQLSGAGTVGSGITYGLGVFYNRKFNRNLLLNIGYSTNLGI